MIDVDLPIGIHTIQWKATDYETLTFRIDVTKNKVVCMSPSVCGKSTAPCVTVGDGGWVVRGTLKSSKPDNYFEWLNLKGGPTDIEPDEVMEIINAYLGKEDIGFEPTLSNVNTAIDYYLKYG